MAMTASAQTEKPNYIRIGTDKAITVENGVRYFIRTETEANSLTVKLFRENELIGEYPKNTSFKPVVAKLPQLYIDMPKDANIERDKWLEGATYQLFDGERRLQGGKIYGGACDIKGRGNTTWNVEKKPYTFRLADKEKKPLLGMPAQRHWALMANAMDFSWLRNSVAARIGRIFNNMGWIPRSEYVEVYINDDYIGVYELTEQIRIDENRVNISKISDENPNGGYLIELVNSLKDDPWFRLFHNRYGNYVSPEDEADVMNANVKDPDQNLENVWDIITSRVWAAEEAIYADDFDDESTGYRKYFDIPSAIDLYWVNEFAKNPDANHGSIYFYYNPVSGKYVFGPPWDFDLTMGNYSNQKFNSPSNFLTINHSYWLPRMLEDPYFKSLAKKRWQEKSAELKSVLDFIDTESEYLREARARDTFIDHYLNNPQNRYGYEAEIELLKSFIEDRIQWINDNIENL
jgi:hypothetical protein